MIEGRDYYYLRHQGGDSVHFTAIHTRTSCDGQCSSSEWHAHGFDGEVFDQDIKRIAFQRMLVNVIAYYEKL